MKKEKQIIVRIDSELFSAYKEYVELKRTTMSHELRQFIVTQILEGSSDVTCI